MTKRLPVFLLVALACRPLDAGLPGPDGAPPGRRQFGSGADASDRVPPRPDGPAAEARPVVDDLSGTAGEPAALGCADGTREGFVDPGGWPHIAGCSGAWRNPGLLGAQGRTPECDRQAGNSGQNASGIGCGVADLCAAGWHVCRDAGEVERRSRTDCESAVPTGQARFFLVLAGASSQGLCSADPAAQNDLHGCGTLGQPETASCAPLDRRFGFADCLAHPGWSCGSATEHLAEASLVFKTDARFGGALCCRD